MLTLVDGEVLDFSTQAAKMQKRDLLGISEESDDDGRVVRIHPPSTNLGHRGK